MASLFSTETDYAGIIEDSSVQVKEMLVGIVSGVLSLLGVIFILLIIYGGFMRMTSGGDEKRMEMSNKILMNSTIGAIVVLLSYAFVKLVFDTVA